MIVILEIVKFKTLHCFGQRKLPTRFVRRVGGAGQVRREYHRRPCVGQVRRASTTPPPHARKQNTAAAAAKTHVVVVVEVVVVVLVVVVVVNVVAVVAVVVVVVVVHCAGPCGGDPVLQTGT